MRISFLLFFHTSFKYSLCVFSRITGSTSSASSGVTSPSPFKSGSVSRIGSLTVNVFPRFDDHDKDVLESLLIMYPIRSEKEQGFLLRRKVKTTVMYKEYWTAEEIVVYEDGKEVDRMTNPYGFIPFVQIKNFPVAGQSRGQGDLDDRVL